MSNWSSGPAPFYGRMSGFAPGSNEALRADNEALKRRIEELNSVACSFGVIVGIQPATVLVTTGGSTLHEITRPHGMDLALGCTVRMRSGEKPAIISRLELPPSGGYVTSIKRLIDERHAEVFVSGQDRVVVHDPDTMDGPPLKASHRVVLDPFAAAVVIKNMGGEEGTQFKFEGETLVTWDDIGGQEEAKRAMREAIEDPIKHKDLFARYKKRPCKGILLHGPRGNGKTMFGKAAASSMAAMHGNKKKQSSGFIYVKGPSILDKFVGESEANVRRLFASCREHYKKEGYRATLFIDEADAVLGVRGSMAMIEGMERTIVPMFLAELDGFEESGAFMLLATNRPDRLDPAILRDGRIDRKVRVGKPTPKDACAILKKALEGRPHRKGIEEAAVLYLHDPKHVLYEMEVVEEGEKKTDFFQLEDVMSGAMLVGLAERAASRAIQREISSGDRGIVEEDLKNAIDEVVQEEKALDHTADILHYIEERKVQIVQGSVVRA